MMTVMQRRSFLKSVASAGLISVSGAPALASERKPGLEGRSPKSTVETADGTLLFTMDWGSGKPILFVHSWAVSSDIWQYQMAAFADRGLRCVAYDRRGHGRSSQPGSGYDIDTLADDLARVIETLDIDGITLVGHSMGACEIVRYLKRHGSERVARIALVAPTTPFLLKTANNPDGIDLAVFEAVRAMWRRDFPKWVSENARPFFTPETSSAMIDWMTNMVVRTPVKVAIDCNRALVETDFRPDLRAVSVPALVIHGTSDASAPIALTGKRTAELIQNCDYKVYADAPHGVMLTHVDRVNADLLAFVKS